MLSFNEYQAKTRTLATYENVGHNTIYPALGLAGESGEASDKIKKLWRNHGFTDGTLYSAEQRKELAKEIGDVLWYVAALAAEIGYSLEEIAELNLDKLFDRKERGVIKSEGDNR